jgi:hypothetical protein
VRIRKPREPEVKKTRAWVALCAVLKTKTQADIETETEVAQSVISSLVTLTRLPGRVTKERLEKLGIRAIWWEEKPRSATRAA